MARRRLTIAVENVNRELDAKLLLAAFAAERGLSVILGEKRELRLRAASLPRSVYLAKDVTPNSRRAYERVAALGHVLAATDEEALVYFSTEQYFKAKVGLETFTRPELLFAWGAENAAIWSEHPGHGGSRIEPSGNPRIDLLRPELRGYWDEEVERLRARHGRFVLVNTNFGLLNNLRDNRNHERRTLEAARRDPASVDAFDVGLAAHRLRLFEGFQEAVGALARARPDVRLIVRPHPSEDEDVWYRAAAGCSNARVVHEGNAVPWLLAAEAVVHNGCTTGLEAWLLGRPVVAFQPVVEDRFEKHLPNSLSHRAYDLGTLQKLVDAALDGSLQARPGEDGARRELIGRWLASLTGPLAAERMADELVELAARVDDPGRRPTASYRALQGAADLGQRWRRRSNRLFKPDLFRRRAAYYGRVFPTLAATELEQKIGRMGGQLGRFGAVRVRPLAKQLFEISCS